MFVYDNFFSKRTAKGTYIDLGAGDGIQNSNTLAYEKKGWVGMLQEDEPSLFDEMVNNRNLDRNKVCNLEIGSKDTKLSEILKATRTNKVDLLSIKSKPNVNDILTGMDWNVPIGVMIIYFDEKDPAKFDARKLLKSKGYSLNTKYHDSEIWEGTDLENFDGNTIIGEKNVVTSPLTMATRAMLLFLVTELVLNTTK